MNKKNKFMVHISSAIFFIKQLIKKTKELMRENNL